MLGGGAVRHVVRQAPGRNPRASVPRLSGTAHDVLGSRLGAGSITVERSVVGTARAAVVFLRALVATAQRQPVARIGDGEGRGGGFGTDRRTGL